MGSNIQMHAFPWRTIRCGLSSLTGQASRVRGTAAVRSVKLWRFRGLPELNTDRGTLQRLARSTRSILFQTDDCWFGSHVCLTCTERARYWLVSRSAYATTTRTSDVAQHAWPSRGITALLPIRTTSASPCLIGGRTTFVRSWSVGGAAPPSRSISDGIVLGRNDNYVDERRGRRSSYEPVVAVEETRCLFRKVQILRLPDDITDSPRQVLASPRGSSAFVWRATLYGCRASRCVHASFVLTFQRDARASRIRGRSTAADA